MTKENSNEAASVELPDVSRVALDQVVIQSLMQYWLCKAEECERLENHYKDTDRVTSQQSAASKEVYRTCVRELKRSLDNSKLKPMNNPDVPEKLSAPAASTPASGSAMDTITFVRFARMSEAELEGYEYALDARLPRIPERWASPDLRDSWITGYLTELRNRLESQNAKLGDRAGEERKP